MPDPVVKVEGRMAPLDRADVDTDQIIPKQFLKRVERTGYGPFLFFDWRQDPSFFLNQARFDGAAVLVAGANFGCGSSREHAPWAIRDAGFRAVIAPSFGDIFRANAFKTGIVAITLPDSQVRHLIDLAAEDPAARIEIDVRAQQVRGEAGSGFAYRFELDPFVKECLVEGLDEISLVERHGEAISRFESSRMAWLPSVNGTTG
ncbi:MAG TPA: 3-isopropylmalate dehydratase small subunit [Candidatus Dormibacteraeota bacterium]|nr:3-isopropylmalate dehydratase small subunit [Candidatus Dormibacteraeota bacterium]